MFRKACLGMLVCCLAASTSFAQAPPRPGPEHEKLKALVGTWDAVMKMQGQEMKATAVYKSCCGGMWLESTFQGDFAGMPFEGRGLDGYDQNKKKYVSVWVDSWTSTPMQLEGNFDPESKLLVMTGEARGDQGTLEKVKTTTEYKDKDHMIFRFYMVESGQNQEAFTIEYSRRK